MKADDMEKAYREVVFGYDEPDLMCANGKTLKEMAAKCGKSITHDTDGNPIIDGEAYTITKEGIHLWREE